jgi:hypothetical protein
LKNVTYWQQKGITYVWPTVQCRQVIRDALLSLRKDKNKHERASFMKELILNALNVESIEGSFTDP